MKCSKCQTENEPGAKFCGDCGASLAPPKTVPRPAAHAQAPSYVFCSKCGMANTADSIFCKKCGSPLAVQVSPPTHTTRSPIGAEKRETSAAWWLLPILMFFFGMAWVGGLIGWLVVREDDPKKAKWLLFLGLGLTILQILLVVAFYVIVIIIAIQEDSMY